MTMILNSADLRNNLKNVLEVVAKKRQPVMIGRFGQPKVVILDVFTYNWQKQVISLIKKIKKLTPAEIETLNILLDDKARNSLFLGLQEAQEGKVIELSSFLNV